LADTFDTGSHKSCDCVSLARHTSANPQLDRDLVTFHLDALPIDAAGLKTAFRKALLVTHPDHGGSNEACREGMAAFARLAKQY
jgi:hypothetical protein